MIKGLMHSMTVCPDLDKYYPSIESAKGIYLFDKEGKKYIDGCSGKAAAANIGHCVPEVISALSDQAAKCAIMPTQSFRSEVVEHYLNKLIEFIPGNYSRAWITTGGTEAIENSVKLALQYHYLKGQGSRHKVIARVGSYHGNSLFALDISGIEYRKEIYKKAMIKHPHIPAANAYRKPSDMGNEEYAFNCAHALEEKINELGKDQVAAFVFEPIVAAALGAVPPPDNSYLKYLRDICTKYDVLMIADEVFTGFGRTGANFAVQHWNIQPDIIAMGKGISGGYFPTGAIVINDQVSEVFVSRGKYFMSGSTFACNPMAAAVGSAVIDYMMKNSLIDRAQNMGEKFSNKLQRLYRHPIVGDIRGKGLMRAIEFVKNRETKLPFAPELRIAQRVNELAREKGAIFYPGTGCYDGFSGDHLMSMPPLIIQEEQGEEIVSILDEAIGEVSQMVEVE